MTSSSDIFANLDAGQTGRISYEDFVKTLTEGSREEDLAEDLHKAFWLFDEHSKGAISFHDVKWVALEVGDNLTDI